MRARELRAKIRGAYGCDCEGEPPRVTDANGPQIGSVRGTRELVERITGHSSEHLTCPWRGFYDDDVAAVVRASRWHEKGSLREWAGDDPEWWLIEGVGLYVAAFEAAHADALAARRKS